MGAKRRCVKGIRGQTLKDEARTLQRECSRGEGSTIRVDKRCAKGTKGYTIKMKMKLHIGSKGEGSMIRSKRKCAKGSKDQILKVKAKTLQREQRRSPYNENEEKVCQRH